MYDKLYNGDFKKRQQYKIGDNLGFSQHCDDPAVNWTRLLNVPSQVFNNQDLNSIPKLLKNLTTFAYAPVML